MNRGDKCKRGFREFGNVTELILNLVQIGDPSYTKQRLEKFCKIRLFRHSKTRATHKMVRKSSCRNKRTKQKDKSVEAVGTDDTGRLMKATNSQDVFHGSSEDTSDDEEEEDVGPPNDTSEEDEDSRLPLESDDSSE